MSAVVEWLYQAVHQVMLALGYPGIFLLMLVENLFPPIPSELVMPFAGFLAGEGQMSLLGVLVAGTCGSLLGAVALYEVGRKLGYERLRVWVCKYGRFFFLSGRDLDMALEMFDRHGRSVILFSRLVPGVRSLISLPAGINRMKMGEFLALTLVGTLIWNTLLAGAGFILGGSWRLVLELIDHYELVIYLLLGGLVIWLALRKWKTRAADSGC